jgi:RimJ/RimL family protein N-acetyltransferase
VKGVRVRRASPNDAGTLFRWRNDPSARRQFLNPSPVSRVDHDRWFASSLASSRCRIYLAEDTDGHPVGQFRLERRRTGAEISVSVARTARGRGVGTLLVRRGTKAAWRELGVRRVVAYVRPENVASAIAFLKAGYRFSRHAVRRGVRTYVFEAVYRV